MTTAARFVLFPCSFVSGSSVTTNLAQMQDFSVNPNASKDRFYAAGAIDPKAHILTSADPQISFSTQDLATYFSIVSPTVGVALTGAGATFRLQERATLDGVFETGATHETFTATKGLICPTRISASQDDQTGAVIQSTLYCLYDGSTNPIVHNTGVDFTSAPTPAFTSEFFLGPIYHNGSEITGVTQVSVDFGIQFVPKRTSGQVFATLGAITRRSPTFTFTTLKADATAALDIFNRALTGTLAIYLAKGADAGSRVSYATGAHCKISAATGVWSDDSISVSSNDDGTVSISIMPTGTIAVSVASTIP
jgi:hypothetical protein